MNSIIEIADYFSKIPTSPFLYGSMEKELVNYIKTRGAKCFKDSNDFSDGIYDVDEYCLYLKIVRGNPKETFFIDSHLDHPGFVLNDKGIGIAFGSLGFDRFQTLLKDSEVNIDIFSNKGDFLSTRKIAQFEFNGKPLIKLENTAGIPNNSHGIWNLPDFYEDDFHIYMPTADNMIATTVMLSLIDYILMDRNTFKDINVTFIFSFLEEVFEVSATSVAMNKSTPFGPINPNDNIVVLESMQSVPLPSPSEYINDDISRQNLKKLRLEDDEIYYSPELRKERYSQKGVNGIYSELGINLPNHESGIVIKVNDTDCVYGFSFPEMENKAELLALHAAENENIPIQHTVTGGACNGTAFSLFPVSSNVITLNIPNPYKHNIGSNGEIVLEKIKKQDIFDAINLLSSMLLNPNKEYHPLELSKVLKKFKKLQTPKNVVRQIQIERANVAWSAKGRLKRKIYFPQTFGEKILFTSRSGMAIIRERLAIRK